MEVNSKGSCAQAEVTDPPSEQLKQPIQLIQRVKKPQLKRKLGRPRKKAFFNFQHKVIDKRAKPEITLPDYEPWTSNRLRQSRREETLEKLKRNVNDIILADIEELKRKGQLKREKCKYATQFSPEATICFVNVKEERHPFDTDMVSDEELGVNGKIESDDRFNQIWPVMLKNEQEIAEHLLAKMQTLSDGRDAANTTAIAPDPDTQFTAFDVLCHSIGMKCGKPNSHPTQQQNQLQRFVKLRTSRPCDYIMSTVAWHKLNKSCNEKSTKIDGCLI